jgi:anti-sigma factor RsiW
VTDHDAVASYALDALDDSEKRAFEEHLSACGDCRDELDSLRETTAALAWAVAGPAPPRALGEVIVERARHERQDIVIALRPSRKSRTMRVLAGAAVAAVVVLGIWVASLHRSLSAERSAHTRLVELLARPDAQRVRLTGGKGTLVVAPSREAAIVFSNLPSAGNGRVYRAWVLRKGSVLPAGTFSGSNVLLSRPVPPGATVAVTREPRGSDGMTPPVLYRASVS